MEPEDYRESLNQLLTQNILTKEAFSQLTNINLMWLNEFLASTASINDLSTEQLDIFSLTIHLFSEGIFLIDNDERVIYIMELLMKNCYLTKETFAYYANVSTEIISLFLTMPQAVDPVLKYRIAVNVMFLFSLFKETMD